jgi:hypothetical protein
MRAGEEKGNEMRAIEDRIREAAETSNLEAEAAAWRSRRARKLDTVAGKVPVVRIRRRALMAAWPASVDRPSSAAPR